ncbi:MAG: hypothetical protein RL748_770 [Pseudomonadota bacterium]|jgi:outer membrane protein OmpA-like peptidoglycan-associated protein
MATWRHRRKAPQQTSDDNWLFAHLKNNFLASLSTVVMVFGLCTIYAYHFHIEYFPQIGIESFTSIIFASTYVGTLLLMGFGAVLFMPSLFIGGIWQEANKKSQRTPPQQIHHLGNLHGASLLSFLTWCLFLFLYDQCAISFGYGSFSALLLWILSLLLRRLRTNRQLPTPLKGWEFRLDAAMFIATYLLGLVLQAFPFFMLAIIIHDTIYLATPTPDYVALTMSLLFCDILLLVLGGYFVFVWFGNPASCLKKAGTLLTMLLFPLVISFFLGNVSFFPATIARVTKVGNFYASEITLSGAGCTVLAKQGVLSCPDKAEEPFKLCGAYVMSRFGSETYIKVNFSPAAKAAAKPAAKGSIASSQAATKAEAAIKLENVYLPTAAILGMKVDTSVRNSNITKIDDHLNKHVSICPEEKAGLKSTPYSFKATELFEHDQSILSSVGQKKLDAFIRLMSDNKKPLDTINIAGHTDQTGSAHYNLTLSQLRAVAVENYLKQSLASDIAPKQFHSQGYGNTRLKKTTGDCPRHWPAEKQFACFAENRRVEIEVTLK